MNALIKIVATALALFICFIMMFFGFIQLMEGYNFLHPDIDTYYTSGFDQKKFESIKPGMDSTQIITLLGQPRDRLQVDSNQCIWYYSGDGKSDSGDYAWLSKEVHINARGKVTKTVEGIYFD